MKESDKPDRVVILGGGFGGIATALTLDRLSSGSVEVVLLVDRPHFEYHGALYRLVTGKSAGEVCISLSEIFANTKVVWSEDPAEEVSIPKKVVRTKSGSVIGFEYLVIAVGSETDYFGIPGLEKWSFGFKSIDEAVGLREHLHQSLASCAVSKDKKEVQCGARVVVVGGGPSGTELAAELAGYLKRVAPRHGVEPSMVEVELVHSGSRLLPVLPEEMSRKIEAKVRSVGVNVWLNHRVEKEEVAKVWIEDMKMATKTVVWTAGVRVAGIVEKIKGLRLNKAGRIVVDGYLRCRGAQGVWAVGDCADTNHTGMAQTALADGVLVGRNIWQKIQGEACFKKTPVEPVYAIPVGPGWAAVWWGGRQYFGTVGWWIRRWLDLKVLMAVLPVRKAWQAWLTGGKALESCKSCSRGVND